MIFKSNKVYDVLVWIASLVLPALALLWSALAEAWKFPYSSQIEMTIVAIDAFLGTILKISSIQYNKINK